jgi:hypothetical protein
VYSILLEGGESLDVGGVECVALGHGLKDAVAQHEYYGSERVVQDLEVLPGFETGRLAFRHGCIERGADGRVAGFSRERLIPPESEECIRIVNNKSSNVDNKSNIANNTSSNGLVSPRQEAEKWDKCKLTTRNVLKSISCIDVPTIDHLILQMQRAAVMPPEECG